MDDAMTSFTFAAIRRAIAEARAEGERIGREKERAEIVAWLRDDVVMKDKGGYIMSLTYQRDPDLADAIERSEHLADAKE